MKVFLMFLFIFYSKVSAIEILLEENKAESGTVGYVDVVKIFNIYSVNFKDNFNKEINEKQKKVDEIKMEIDHYIAKKEKLKTEYEIAKIFEEFYKNIEQQNIIEDSSQTYIASNSTTNQSYQIDVSTDSSSSTSQDFSISDSTLSYQNKSQDINMSTQTPQIEEPYIMMPGVGKFPLSNYKFSISSKTAEISKAIEQLDEIISKLKNDVLELKKKYDEELSKKAAKENEKIFKKIYYAIEEVSKEERVSIVVDKKNILYGRKTLDLTDKVIKKLREQ